MTDDALGALDAVAGYAWTWTGCGTAGSSGFGVTAQDFAKVCPAAVHHDATLGGLVVDYHAVAALNLCAAKALKAQNDARVRDATGLHRRLEALEAALAALAAQPACALRHSACRCTCVWTPTGACACTPLVHVPAPPTDACACPHWCLCLPPLVRAPPLRFEIESSPSLSLYLSISLFFFFFVRGWTNELVRCRLVRGRARAWVLPVPARTRVCGRALRCT